MKKTILILPILLSVLCFSQNNFSIPRDTTNYPKIRKDLTRINNELKRDTSNCFLYFKRNLLNFELLNLLEAKADLNKAISLCPNDTLTYFYYYQRGSLNDKLNLKQEAFDDFSKSMALKPNFEGAYLDRGTFLTNSGYFKEGKLDLEKALIMHPNWSDAFFILGTNYDYSGDKDSAILYYQKAIEKVSKKDKFLIKSYNNIGVIYNQRTKYKEAVAMFDKALEIQNNYVLALTNRAEAKFHLGDKKGACEDISKAIKLGRDDLKKDFEYYCK